MYSEVHESATAEHSNKRSSHQEIDYQSEDISEANVSSLNVHERGQELAFDSSPWTVDTIINLRETGSFTYEKKLQAKTKGRPLPLFSFDGKRPCKLMDEYNTHQWLCGCSKRKALFCFPCLLFSCDRSSCMSGQGLTDFSNFTNHTWKHAKSPSHLSSLVALSLLGKVQNNDSVDSFEKRSKECHNLEVKSNREMLKHHIRAAIYLVSQGLSFHSHKEDSEDDSNNNKGNFVELVSAFTFFSENEKIKAALTNCQKFTGFSEGIQNDLIEILYVTVREEISRRIQQANCISIVLDEVTDMSSTSPLCVSVRLVHEGFIHEHLIDVVDVSADRSVTGVAEKLTTSLKTCAGIDSFVNVIGQSHDGASCLTNSDLSVHQLLQGIWPQAKFVHCHAHKWAHIVCKACETITPEITFFFGFIHNLSNFFKATPSRADLLSGAIPGVSPTHWLSRVNVISTVDTKYAELITVLESVNASCIYDSATRAEANGLLHQLSNLNTIFLLKLFEKVISLSDVLTQLLQNKNIDPLVIEKTVEDYKNSMLALKSDHLFIELWKAAIQRNAEFSQCRQSGDTNVDKISDEYMFGLKEKLKSLMIKVAETVLKQLTLRFDSLTDFTGVQLFNPDNFEKYRNDKQVVINSLSSLHPHVLSDWEDLLCQLSILYNDVNIQAAIQNIHDPAVLLKCLNDLDLCCALPSVSKALTACLTLPLTDTPGKKGTNLIRRVKNYLKSTNPQTRRNHLMILYVESSILKFLSSKNDFYDMFIDKFAHMKERGINLLYQR